MRLVNGTHGYGVVSKALHWATVVAMLAQFVLGYLIDVGGGRGRGRGRGGEPGRGRGRGGESTYLEDLDALLTAHVVLGLAILVLAVARVLWRRIGGLPPWAPGLSSAERRVAAWTEKALLGLLFVVPASGIALVLGGEDDLLALHVGAHIAFFVAITMHVGLMLKHQAINRDGLLRRMTWAAPRTPPAQASPGRSAGGGSEDR